MNNIHSDRLKGLRQLMKANNVEWYVIHNCDPHQSEYISEHDRIVKWLCGFSGSNATLVIGESKACLWTDGRYFLQAENEIKGSGFSLVKIGVKGEPTVLEFLQKNIKAKENVAFDGKYISILDYKKYKKITDKKHALIKTDVDVICKLWRDRNERIFNPIWELGSEYSGTSSLKKISKLRSILKKEGMHGIFVSDLTQIAWLLNLRGSDIHTVPVFFAYLYIDMETIKLFIQKDKLGSNIDLKDIEIFRYEDVCDVLKAIENKTILVDPESVSVSIKNSFSNSVNIIEKESPIDALKAVKNRVEIKNTIEAHILDGVALTKAIFELKTKKTLKSELDVAKRLYELRSSMPGFLDESFTTIAAYGPNAAMMHYSARENSYSRLYNKGFILIDSGGHYLTGTTDVTRTIALGELSKEQIQMYTLVLKSHLDLMDARFLKGTTGENLDILARNELWRLGLDYRSGTGHGVGHILCVHEGPHSIRYRFIKDRPPKALEPGMIVTDEPGYYEDGNYGIRIENELLVTKYKQTEYGDFYRFKALTLVPYERDAIDETLLNDRQRSVYNSYNRLVRKALSPYLNEEERKWLIKATAPIV